MSIIFVEKRSKITILWSNNGFFVKKWGGGLIWLIAKIVWNCIQSVVYLSYMIEHISKPFYITFSLSYNHNLISPQGLIMVLAITLAMMNIFAREFFPRWKRSLTFYFANFNKIEGVNQISPPLAKGGLIWLISGKCCWHVILWPFWKLF